MKPACVRNVRLMHPAMPAPPPAWGKTVYQTAIFHLAQHSVTTAVPANTYLIVHIKKRPNGRFFYLFTQLANCCAISDDSCDVNVWTGMT